MSDQSIEIVRSPNLILVNYEKLYLEESFNNNY